MDDIGFGTRESNSSKIQKAGQVSSLQRFEKQDSYLDLWDMDDVRFGI